MLRIFFLAIALTLSCSFALAQTPETPGSLTVTGSNSKETIRCPLKHTDVKVEITGFISRVIVTQQFENTFKERIEAVYTFPLPQNAAVDDMTMMVGDRTIRGKILPREEAQAVYEAARTSGRVASLLDQERPNIFTQSIANILPGEKVKVQISYVETLKYEDGAYEFVFPMVVGPRYVPGAATTTGTTQVPDAGRIDPPSAVGTRAGHDIAISVNLDAGLLIDSVASKSHDVDLQRPDPRSARVKLKDFDTIPNRDFILKFDVAGAALQDALLTHRSERGGYFTMILQPPQRVAPEDVTPKELVFVLDTSGSMNGFPIEKAKETMKLALDSLYPSDTFNIITFAGDTHILFPEPVPASKGNLEKAQQFLSSRSGAGGTEMMNAIRVALEPTDSQKHVRIVCFMTDGYVGNEMAIIAEIQKHQNARVFSFGIGSSVNRFLLDKMAEAGRGEVEYVALTDDGSAAAKRFHERVRNPLLTDISIDWNGLPIADVYPKQIPDLFGAKPVVLTGRYTSAARGSIRLKGRMAGNDFVREIPFEFPESMATHDVLASLWARQRIDDLMSKDYKGVQLNNVSDELKNTITQLGIEYRLMTQYTSFVAVEEMVVTDGGAPRRVDVPVEVPSGVNPETTVVKTANISYGYVGGARTIQNLPLQGRAYETVTVTSASESINTSQAGVSQSTVNPATPPKEKKPKQEGLGSGTATRSGTNTFRVDAVDTMKVSTDVVTTKANAVVLALIDRIKNKRLVADPNEAKFVRDGKAELRVWLTDKSDENLAKLKELGFEIVLDPKTSKVVIGRIAIEKLEALVKASFVSYVGPEVRK